MYHPPPPPCINLVFMQLCFEPKLNITVALGAHSPSSNFCGGLWSSDKAFCWPLGQEKRAFYPMKKTNKQKTTKNTHIHTKAHTNKYSCVLY